MSLVQHTPRSKRRRTKPHLEAQPRSHLLAAASRSRMPRKNAATTPDISPQRGTAAAEAVQAHPRRDPRHSIPLPPSSRPLLPAPSLPFSPSPPLRPSASSSLATPIPPQTCSPASSAPCSRPALATAAWASSSPAIPSPDTASPVPPAPRLPAGSPKATSSPTSATET